MLNTTSLFHPLRSRQRTRDARFLLECLFVLEPERPALRQLAGEGLDWGRIHRLAAGAAVVGAVYRSIADADLRSLVAPEVLSRLESQYRAAAARSTLLQLRELAAISAALEAQGVRSIVLKGPALLLTRYPDPGTRASADVDLLIEPGHEGDAVRVLESRGYIAKPDPEGVVREPAHGHHLAPYVHARGIACELHRWILGPGARCREEFEALWSRSREVPCSRGRVRVPSDVDSLAIACSHVFENHDGALPYLPRLLTDLHVLLARDPVDVGEALRLHPEHAPAILEGLGLLAACGRGLGLPTARPRYEPLDLFAPSLGLRDVRQVADRALNIAKHPYGAFRGMFPSERWMRSLYGPGWLPRLYARRFVEKLIPDSLRKW